VTGYPDWLRDFVAVAHRTDVPEMMRPPGNGARAAAVLILFGEGAEGPDLLLLQRADTMRKHAGQPAFPGGGIDPGDGGPVGAALREAEEETGLDPAGVLPLAVLPDLFIPPTGFVVTPVLAYWADPGAVHAVDPGETAAVVRVPVAALADPANRLQVRHPSGYTGPAFHVAGLVVWGFTGGLLSSLLRLGGWERPWNATRVWDLDEAWAAARTQGQEVRES
jgi:8-oxo-dGTP pyrophosphatase MutT (NUDIX family)